MTQDRPLLEQIVDFAARRQVTLPVFSNVATKLRAAAGGSYNILEIERAIDSDQALAAEVLRAANSADRKSTRLNSSHVVTSRMPSSA